MTQKLKDLVNKQALEYILTKDEAIMEKVKRVCAKHHDREGLDERIRKYGAIMLCDMVGSILKKEDRKYYDLLSHEIKQKGGDAEIDIDYLEKIIPPMRMLNFTMGFYNKQYGPDEREIIEVGYSIRTGGRKPIESHEKFVLLPYNITMKKSD